MSDVEASGACDHEDLWNEGVINDGGNTVRVWSCRDCDAWFKERLPGETFGGWIDVE
ncbi:MULTISPECIES: hypothetical protein [Halococcus]|uniref:hypothetical protein n=1 Tax=Halococcus TaxID=2249 RepID=UPI001314463D|nr:MULTISPECIES: hypothetical protein [Halococcus]